MYLLSHHMVLEWGFVRIYRSDEWFTSVVGIESSFNPREYSVVVLICIIFIIVIFCFYRWKIFALELFSEIVFLHRILIFLDSIRDINLRNRNLFINIFWIINFWLTRRDFTFVISRSFWPSFRSSSRSFFHKWWEVLILLLVQIYFIYMGRF